LGFKIANVTPSHTSAIKNKELDVRASYPKDSKAGKMVVFK